MVSSEILQIIRSICGKTAFFYKNLVTQEEYSYAEDRIMIAASIIKIPIMLAFYHQIWSKQIDPNTKYRLAEKDKKPSCGVLNMLQEGTELTLEDLCKLMIIVSDNTATNILIEFIGMDKINDLIKEMGYEKTRLNRLLFDREASDRGVQNYVTAYEIADMLERIYRRDFFEGCFCQEMINILKNQRLNHKIPFYMADEIEIAHKTGEDDGITHDVGIIFAKTPFLVCFLGNQVDVPEYEKCMQKISWELFMNSEEQ